MPENIYLDGFSVGGYQAIEFPAKRARRGKRQRTHPTHKGPDHPLRYVSSTGEGRALTCRSGQFRGEGVTDPYIKVATTECALPVSNLPCLPSRREAPP